MVEEMAPMAPPMLAWAYTIMDTIMDNKGQRDNKG